MLMTVSAVILGAAGGWAQTTPKTAADSSFATVKAVWGANASTSGITLNSGAADSGFVRAVVSFKKDANGDDSAYTKGIDSIVWKINRSGYLLITDKEENKTVLTVADSIVLGCDDTLWVKPLGLRGGAAVTITGKSKKRPVTATTGTLSVTVNSTKNPPTFISANSVIPGLYSSGTDTAIANVRGQLIVRWNVPSGNNIIGYDVYAKRWVAGDTLNVENDTLGLNSGRILASTYILAGESVYGLPTGTAGVTLRGDITRDDSVRVFVRTVYAASTAGATGNIGEANVSGAAMAGGSGNSARFRTPAKWNSAGTVTYAAPSTPIVYDGSSKTLTAATISATQDAAILAIDSLNITYKYWYSDGSTPVSWTSYAYAPVNAGNCSTEVHFKNSTRYSRKAFKYKIEPKPLTKDMIHGLTVKDGVEQRVYDGTAQTPGFEVLDDKNYDPNIERELVIGTHFIGYRSRNLAVGNAGRLSLDSAYVNNVNVGIGLVKIVGINNYKDTVESSTFTIFPKPLTIDVEGSAIDGKVYDGTAIIDSADVKTVKFAQGDYQQYGLVDADISKFETYGRDSLYIVTRTGSGSLGYNGNGDVKTTTSAKVEISLPAGSNYRLVPTGGPTGAINAASVKLSLEKPAKITPKAPEESDFNFVIDTGHLYTNLPRGIAQPTFKIGNVATNAGGNTLTVLYDGDTAKPREVGSYEVSLLVTPKDTLSNFSEGVVALGTYIIGAPRTPEITQSWGDESSIEIRTGKPLTLSVEAVSPNRGTLSYQWFKNGVAINTSAGKSKSLTPSTAVVGSFDEYYVRVTNTVNGVQVPASDSSGVVTVSVKASAKNMQRSVVLIETDSVWNMYDGTELTAPVIEVYHEGELVDASAYDIEYRNNVNAGTARVEIIGKDEFDFEGTALGSFLILRKPLERDDWTAEEVVTYNGEAQPLDIVATDGRTGLGTPVVRYNGSTTAPTNAGKYTVIVSFPEGRNFTASSKADTLEYEIAKLRAIASDLNYSIPTGNVYNGKAQGKITASLKGTGGGTVKVTYSLDGEEISADSVIDAGEYIVDVVISGGVNYEENIVNLEEGYTIAKKVPAVTDFTFTIPANHVENGEPQGIDEEKVTLNGSKNGLLEVFYDGVTGAPSAPKNYVVSVGVSYDSNYEDTVVVLGMYRISRTDTSSVAVAKAAVSNAAYVTELADVSDVVGAKAYVDSIVAGIVAEDEVIAVVSTVDLVADDTLSSVYRFTVALSRGVVSDTTDTLSLAITKKQVVSVSQNDHVIPGDNVEQAVVAPISVVAGEFTVGPNPVAKAAGKVSFFWQGKALSGGTLYVFDGSGNLVTKVAVSDRGVSAERRAVAGWNLVDAKGRAVAEGTYLVKGALVGKDGGKVKVSSILGVSK